MVKTPVHRAVIITDTWINISVNWWCKPGYAAVIEKSVAVVVMMPVVVSIIVTVVIARAAVSIVIPTGICPVAEFRKNPCVRLAGTK